MVVKKQKIILAIICMLFSTALTGYWIAGLHLHDQVNLIILLLILGSILVLFTSITFYQKGRNRYFLLLTGIFSIASVVMTFPMDNIFHLSFTETTYSLSAKYTLTTHQSHYKGYTKFEINHVTEGLILSAYPSDWYTTRVEDITVVSSDSNKIVYNVVHSPHHTITDTFLIKKQIVKNQIIN
jgi:hypothetical protein